MTYTDYNGILRTEDFYFNISKAEAAEMELTTEGGLSNIIKEIIDSNDKKKLVMMFKDLILNAYGEKSADGKHFVKNDKVKNAFSQTEAYSDLFMELATNDVSAAEFINGITPIYDTPASTTTIPATQHE